jgi:hypothetical protein
MLDHAAEVWVQEGPRDTPYSYVAQLLWVHNFRKYAQERVQMTSEKVLGNKTPELAEKLAWFEKVKPTLATEPTMEERNTIIAGMLLPSFEKSRNNWDSLRFLGKACLPLPTDLKDFKANSQFDFTQWLEAVSPELKEFVNSIGSLLQISKTL